MHSALAQVHLPFRLNETEDRGGRGEGRSSGDARRRSRQWEGSGRGGMDRPLNGGPPRTSSVTGDGRTRASPTSPVGGSYGLRRPRRFRRGLSEGRGRGASSRSTELNGGGGRGGGGPERGGGREGRAEELWPVSGPEATGLRLGLPGGALEGEERGELLGGGSGGLYRRGDGSPSRNAPRRSS